MIHFQACKTHIKHTGVSIEEEELGETVMIGKNKLIKEKHQA